MLPRLRASPSKLGALSAGRRRRLTQNSAISIQHLVNSALLFRVDVSPRGICGLLVSTETAHPSLAVTSAAVWAALGTTGCSHESEEKIGLRRSQAQGFLGRCFGENCKGASVCACSGVESGRQRGRVEDIS